MNFPCFVQHSAVEPINITLVTVAQFESWLAQQDLPTRHWLQKVAKHPATAGSVYLTPHQQDRIKVIAIINNIDDYWIGGNLAANLPPGIYACTQPNDNFIISWGLGAYSFRRYKTLSTPNSNLTTPQL